MEFEEDTAVQDLEFSFTAPVIQNLLEEFEKKDLLRDILSFVRNTLNMINNLSDLIQKSNTHIPLNYPTLLTCSVNLLFNQDINLNHVATQSSNQSPLQLEHLTDTVAEYKACLKKIRENINRKTPSIYSHCKSTFLKVLGTYAMQLSGKCLGELNVEIQKTQQPANNV